MTPYAAFLKCANQLPHDDTIRRRLERALNIVQNGHGYEVIHQGEQIWLVRKLATSLLGVDTQYWINEEIGTCTCPDFPTVRSGLCKHRLAVKMIEIMKAGK